MLCEAFRRLSVFQAVESYRYIGFGSFYFADFKLIHKSLGITDMLSFELQSRKRERFEFNNPFRCIKLRFGHSNRLLRDHWRNRRTILWLDYDDPLDKFCLRDIGFFCNNAMSGSVLIVTVDAQVESEPAKLEREFSSFRERVRDDIDVYSDDDATERERIPFGIAAEDLAGWGTAKISHRIIMNEIAKVVSERNFLTSEQLVFRQLFNFRYKDTAQMLTVGGILYADSESDNFEACDFGSLNFVRTGSIPYTIELPKLTFREIRYLDSQLPINPSKLKSKGIKAGDLRKYAKVYRWFPSFAEVEM
ncbi:MAG TPA: O-methyltransferase [Pyrinomonadaceae bacterium]|nr:O-methyltransferase [Pyrinomonadaceae bacterium]